MGHQSLLDKELLDKLNALLPVQLEEIVFRLGVPPAYLTQTPQAARSIEVLRYLIAQGRAQELAQWLVNQSVGTVVPAKGPGPGPLIPSRPLIELVIELQKLLIERAQSEVDDVKRETFTLSIDALVAEVKRRARVKEGDVVAGTRLLKVIGTGSFGTIYLARKVSNGVTVATKVFQLDKLTDGMMLWSFRRSIKAMQDLNSDKHAPASIVRIHNAADDTLAFSMDYLPGGNLENIASRGWTLEKKMDVFAEVCRSVAFAHAKSIIHRDVKPANVVLSEQLQPVLTDFDISDVKYLTHLSVANGGIGTAMFAAPEQLEDAKNATERSDIYSLGRLLYYLLLERSPGPEMDAEPKLLNIASFPPTLVAIVRRATQHDPGKRYGSVTDLLRDIESYESRAAALRARVNEVARWMRMNAALLVIFSMVVSGLSGFGIYQTHVAKDKEEQRKQQELLANRNAELVEKLRKLQKDQEEAQRVLNQLAQNRGSLNQQRVAIDHSLKLLDAEIKASLLNAEKLRNLRSDQADLRNKLKTLNIKQVEFDRQVREQQHRLEEAKKQTAATLSPGAAAASPPPKITPDFLPPGLRNPFPTN